MIPRDHDPYCLASRGHYKCECTLIRMVITRERDRITTQLLALIDEWTQT